MAVIVRCGARELSPRDFKSSDMLSDSILLYAEVGAMLSPEGERSRAYRYRSGGRRSDAQNSTSVGQTRHRVRASVKTGG